MTEPHKSGAVEDALARLMLVGVYGSTACLVAGLIAWSVQHESPVAANLLTLGLVVLMTTPALRVLNSAIEAVRLRDWLHLATIIAVAILLGAAVTVAMAA